MRTRNSHPVPRAVRLPGTVRLDSNGRLCAVLIATFHRDARGGAFADERRVVAGEQGGWGRTRNDLAGTPIARTRGRLCPRLQLRFSFLIREFQANFSQMNGLRVMWPGERRPAVSTNRSPAERAFEQQ